MLQDTGDTAATDMYGYPEDGDRRNFRKSLLQKTTENGLEREYPRIVMGILITMI
jgi:hypothetical protein